MQEVPKNWKLELEVEKWQMVRVYDKIKELNLPFRYGVLYYSYKFGWHEGSISSRGISSGRGLSEIDHHVDDMIYPKEVLLTYHWEYGYYHFRLDSWDSRYNCADIIKEILENDG